MSTGKNVHRGCGEGKELLAEEMEAGGEFVEGFMAAALAEAELADADGKNLLLALF